MSGKFSASNNTAKKKQATPVEQPSKLLVSNIVQISISVAELPSKGISYPEKSHIQYRPYTFGEIKKVSQSKLDVKTSFKFILEGIETPFDIMDLTVGDFFYLGLLRRLSTLGSDKIILPYKCNGCGKVSKHIIETNSIGFDDMEAPLLPVQADFGERELEFNPLTLRGLFELIDLNKHDDEIALLAKQCSNIEFEEMYNFIDKAGPDDTALIQEVDKILYHSVSDVVFNCKETIDDKVCGRKNTIELDGGQALIMPFREGEKPIRSKIHFGKSNAHKSN